MIQNTWTGKQETIRNNEIMVGTCPVCHAPIYSPKIAHIVGPFPVRVTCHHYQAREVAEFVRPRPLEIIW
jgi:hypothetical protein